MDLAIASATSSSATSSSATNSSATNSVTTGSAATGTAATGSASTNEAANAAIATEDAAATFTHVAIVERTSVRDDSLYVIEAVPQRGVVRRPLKEFVSENGRELLSFRRVERSIVLEIAKRQSLTPEEVLQSFVDNAKSHIGEYYDYVYMPDNEMTYCSELVYDSYLDSSSFPGDIHLFEAKPMNFYDSNGHLPEFWAGLFDYLGVPVPQGVPGTNPEDMYHSRILADIGDLSCSNTYKRSKKEHNL